MIGKIRRVPLREVWRHEAYDLTTWLEDNIDVLSDAIDLPLGSVEREQAAGSFSVDLVAEDTAGNTIIIENQLGKSDHDHLGKVLTYLVAFEARVAVWIVGDPRPEHVSAFAWLNEVSSADFYLLKLEAIQIDDSLPAPLLTEIVGPSEEAKEVGRTKQELAGRYALRHQFWTELLVRVKARNEFHSNISPTKWNWLGASAGRSGLSFNYTVRRHDTSAGLFIDLGAEEINKTVFEYFLSRKEEVEREYGAPLTWDQVDGRRSCVIRAESVKGGYRDEDKWEAAHGEVIDSMAALVRAIRPHIDAMPRNLEEEAASDRTTDAAIA